MDLDRADVTEIIIGCAFRVHQVLGHGFLEKVYENAVMIELEKSGLRPAQQMPIPVFYDGHRVGEYFADILVGDEIICELKAGDGLSRDHEVQLVNYLAATGKPFGLLIHFGKKVTVRRKFRERLVRAPGE